MLVTMIPEGLFFWGGGILGGYLQISMKQHVGTEMYVDNFISSREDRVKKQ